jgi:hypothetical protein
MSSGARTTTSCGATRRATWGVLHPELVGNVTREDILAQAEQL